MEAVATVVAELVWDGHVAVYWTAESWADLQPENVFKQLFFFALTASASSLALHFVMSDLKKREIEMVDNSAFILHVKSFCPASAGVISLASGDLVLEGGHGVGAGPGQGGVDGDLLAAGLDAGAAAGQDGALTGSIAC